MRAEEEKKEEVAKA